jgi:CheY-like chemotaxis protein
MNGQEAVNQWRTGGFHLVLMDIQLPVMNGLEATKEIRRLEALNGIGVFSGSPIDVIQAGKAADSDNLEKELFKSPVIIVALTASSLQSDRHEALAAGCNDFLTKVNRISSLLSFFGTDAHTCNHSLSTSPGWSAKSPNGAACRLSLTLMAGASGKTMLAQRPLSKKRRKRPLRELL